MPSRRVLDLRFPVGGLLKRLAFQGQTPYTSPDLQNVRPDESIAGRERGGSRPGLGKVYPQVLGGGAPIRLLTNIEYVDATGVLRNRVIASAGGSLYRSTNDDASMEQVSSTLTLSSDRNLMAVQRGQRLFIADYDGVKAIGTDGTTNVAGTGFTSASYANWLTLGFNTADYVVVVVSGTGATAGTYKISSITAGTITLSSSAGVSASAITFRVERAPKVYDPSANTLAIWTATSGTVPNGNQPLALWRDRIVTGGGVEAPHLWYMSKQGDAYNWDNSATGVARAISGTQAEAGRLGEPLKAIIPHADDCCFFACTNSFWVMRGDPAMGGQLLNLSRSIGIVDKTAWCYTPEGFLFFLSLDGLYMVPPGCGSAPISISREKLPEELLGIGNSIYTVTMAYNLRDRGIHLFLTKNAAGTTTHWFLDEKTTLYGDAPGRVGFFKDAFATTDHDPTALLLHPPAMSATKSPVLLGCRDGYIRQHDTALSQDSGGVITSYVIYGPLELGDGYNDGSLEELICTGAEGGGDISWAIRAGNSAEAAFSSATNRASGTFGIAGLNYKARPKVRGAACVIKLSNGEPNAEWGIERLLAVVEKRGTLRKS